MRNLNLRYFKERELNCRCGCGLYNIDYKLAVMLDTARTIAKIPFIINSCCRCEEHNKNIGGSETSSHLKGLAVDIKAIDSLTRFRVVDSLLKAGFKRILIYSSFIHTDIDTNKISPIIKIMKR